MASQDLPPIKTVGSLWRGKEGSKALLTGTIKVEGQDVRVMVFKCKERPSDRHPEFYISAEDTSTSSVLGNKSAGSSRRGGDDDVPF